MLLDHNLTVRSAIIETLERLNTEDFMRDSGSGSVRDILVHVIDTERYWISVLTGGRSNHLDPTDFGTIRDIKAIWCEAEEFTKGFLNEMSEEQLVHVKSVRRNDKTTYFTVAKALLHLAAHEIHHQGQVVGLIRQFGLDSPDTDML